MPLEILSDWN